MPAISTAHRDGPQPEPRMTISPNSVSNPLAGTHPIDRLLRSRLFQLLLLAVLVRLVTFGNPIVDIDEQYYFVVADAMRHGALPYVDIWDRKPIGLFLIYLPAALAGPVAGIYIYQMMALAAVLLTALIIARLADNAGWH